MMAEEIPLIPKASKILVHTGNIVNWNRLKRKLTQSPTEELTECISSTINAWVTKADKNEIQYVTDVECLNQKFLEKLEEEERDGMKLTVKIFSSGYGADTILEAIDKVLCELGTSYVEIVILSVPDVTDQDSWRPMWEKIETYVEQGKVLSLGISNLNKDQLEDLYNWAKVKPCFAQINLEECCTVPPELQEYAKEKDISLLTHNDPKEILPLKTFQDVLQNNLTTRDSQNWEPKWVARSSVLIKSRGIVKSKGYILQAERDLKKRK